MNISQINKIRKRAEREVAARREKEEKKEQAHKDEIQKTIIEYESQYPKRGKCLCFWKGSTYLIDDIEKQVRIDPIIGSKELQTLFEKVGTTNGKTYYMLTGAAVEKQQEFMKWVSDKYGIIKMACVSIEKENSPAGDKLKNMYMLGAVREELRQKFPDRSMLDLIEAVKVLDRLIQKECSE